VRADTKSLQLGIVREDDETGDKPLCHLTELIMTTTIASWLVL